MIALEVDGVFLDMRRDQKMRLILRGQVFYRDFVAAGYTYPFTLPYTPTNAKAMRFYDRIASTGTFADIPCNVWLGGNYWKAGVIQYKRFSNGYDINVVIPEDEVLFRLRNVSTNDLEQQYQVLMDGGSSEDFIALIDGINGTIDDTDIVFPPMRNTGKFGGAKETYFGVDVSVPPENYIAPTSEWVNIYKDNVGGSIELSFNEYCPMPYLVRVMEHVMALVGKQVIGDVVNDPVVRTMAVASNLHIPVMTTESHLVYAVLPGTRYVKLRDMLPKYTGLEFLIRMMRRFNAIPVFQGGKILFRSMNAILNEDGYDDLTAWMEQQKQLENDPSGGLTLKEERDTLEKGRKSASVDQSRLIGTVPTLVDLSTLTPEPGDFAKVVEDNYYYQYRQEGLTPVAWVKAFEDFGDYTVGTEPRTQDVGVGLLSMVTAETPTGATITAPSTEMILHDPYFNMHGIGYNRTSSLRLVYIRGEALDSEGQPYLQASTSTLDAEDRVVAERLGGEGSIYDVWYKAWQLQLQSGRYIKRRMRIPMHVLRTWRWDRKIMLDGSLYLCKEIDMEVSTTGMGLATLELLRLTAGRSDRTAGTPSFLCSGPGYISFELAFADEGTDFFSFSTTGGYFVLRDSDGNETVYAVGDNPVLAAGSYCLWCANAAGEVNGSFDLIAMVGAISALDLSGIEGHTLSTIGINNTLLTSLVFPACTIQVIETISNVLLTAWDASDVDGVEGIDADGNSVLSLPEMPDAEALNFVDFGSCALAEAAVNGIAVALAGNGIANGGLALNGGTNAAPTGSGAAAISGTLLPNGWTVSTN